MEALKITKAAVGRFARIGDLYDARRDEFVGTNSLKTKLSEDDIYEDDVNSSDIEFMVSDRLNEKLDKLWIDTDLGLSILTGLVKPNGPASYLQEQKSSPKVARMTLTYSLRTVDQEVDVIKNKIDRNVIKNCQASHVVVGIKWGARCIITCEYLTVNDTINKEELRAEIEKLKDSISLARNASADIASSTKSKEEIFSYYLTCEIRHTNNSIPLSFEAAVTSAVELPSIVKSSNSGKGIPLSYTLMPIKALRKMLKIKDGTNIVCTHIGEDLTKNCLLVFEELFNIRQKLNHLVKTMIENEDDIVNSYIKTVTDLERNFEICETDFKGKLLQLIIDIRSGKCDTSYLTKLLDDFPKKTFSSVDMEKRFKAYDDILGKIELMDKMKRKNVLFLRLKTEYELASNLYETKHVYILYMNYTFRKLEPENWKKQIALFFNLLRAYKDDKTYKFIVVDIDVSPCLKTKKKKTSIEYFDNGVLKCKDVLAKEGLDLEMNVVKVGNITPLKKKIKKKVLLFVRCPMSFEGFCSQENVFWVCKNCRAFIEYVIHDENIYCKCGEAHYSEAEFRCSGQSHGLFYAKYEETLLKQILNKPKVYKETNILILGETGVGKSTWINAISNYLVHRTMWDAKDCASDIRVPIPSRFLYTDENGKTMSIAVGNKSSNEVQQEGQSATQGPKSYKFLFGHHLIRLIDTPGIGDARGLEQDEKNFERILLRLSNYDEIHGICLLLKPNDSRLTTKFRFCLTELLTRLHKSAAENIIFCFTNARNTLYRPGDTLPILKTLISKYKTKKLNISPINQFCFDNEAFRFLACLKNGVSFEEQDLETYSASWDRAASETLKLFHYISQLCPHSVKHTVSLNNARRIVLQLGKVLAEIAAKIEGNTDSVKRKSKKLKATKSTIEGLKAKLYLKGEDVQKVHLNYTRTVCTSSSCVDNVQALNGVKKTVFKQPCHDHCTVDGIPAESVNSVKLQECQAMESGPNYNCKVCGHSWKVHMQVTYDLKRVNKEVIDQNVNMLLNNETNKNRKRWDFISMVNTNTKELKEEQQKITNVCIQFGYYLKKNAIEPFNNDIDDYLQLLIKQEKNKPEANEKLIDHLSEMRRKYEQKNKIITQVVEGAGITDSDYIPEPENIEDLQQLFTLKHSGQSIQDLFTNIHSESTTSQMRWVLCFVISTQNPPKMSIPDDSQ